jgi:ribonuclease VapC
VKRNGRACLDAFAWLAWLQDEPGAAAVQRWLDEAQAGRAECVTSVINLGEAYCRLVRVERREQAESLWRLALRGTLPVSVKDATRRRVLRAADLKSQHAMAYADAFAVATGVEFNAILLTGDPEIEPLEKFCTSRSNGSPVGPERVLTCSRLGPRDRAARVIDPLRGRSSGRDRCSGDPGSRCRASRCGDKRYV